MGIPQFAGELAVRQTAADGGSGVHTGRFDLNPARNTREKLLLPLGDIKPLQQAGVYLAVMNQAGTLRLQ